MEKLREPESGLFRNLSKDEVRHVLNCLSAAERKYQKGDVVFHAGTVTGSMGLVIKGTIEIVRDDYWGNRQVLGTAGPGELFAESYACSMGEPMMVTARASEASSVLFLEVRKILTTCSPACEFHSRLIHNLLYVLAEKNLNLTRKIDHMGQRTIREKVMAYLSFQAERHNSGTFTIPFNRQQLADYLAVDRSALSAEMSRMKRDGIIDYEKNRFTVAAKDKEAERV